MTPRFMRERHEALQKAYDLLKNNSIYEIFSDKITTHGGLRLLWIKELVQENFIGPCDQYQIVIASLGPSQQSESHFHEVGSSSFLVLGPETRFPEPQNFTYRYLYFGESGLINSVKCEEKDSPKDILPWQIHQFKNLGKYTAWILIVTHPIITIKENEYDLYPVPNFGNPAVTL